MKRQEEQDLWYLFHGNIQSLVVSCCKEERSKLPMPLLSGGRYDANYRPVPEKNFHAPVKDRATEAIQLSL